MRLGDLHLNDLVEGLLFLERPEDMVQVNRDETRPLRTIVTRRVIVTVNGWMWRRAIALLLRTGLRSLFGLQFLDLLLTIILCHLDSSNCTVN